MRTCKFRIDRSRAATPSALMRVMGLAAVVTVIATAVHAAPVVTPYVSGLSGVTGAAYHQTNQHVYFLEANSGRMSKVNTANAAVTVIQTGLVHPDDLALFPGANIAYITTRVGELWKASTVSNGRTLVASGLGIPLEIVLDPGSFAAYTVDYASGTLWRVELAGGNKVAMVTGLNQPRGLLMSPDFKTAIVSEANRLVSVDLPTQQVTELVGSLVNPWYMDWAADDHTALYLAERAPGNRLHRVDLTTTPPTLQALTALPAEPWSVVRSTNPDVLYAGSQTVLSKVSLSGGAGGPIITRLGFVPSTEIDPLTGQATTDPAYFFYVKNASFGGSIHVMLNFPGMLNAGATYYKVFVDASPDIATWTNYKWNMFTFVLQNVGPSAGFYKIPTPGEVWAIPDLGYVLDSTKFSNAKHKLRVALYDGSYNPLNIEGTVDMLVDNNPPVMDIQQIEHDGQPLNECALITSGTGDIKITFKAFDAEGHLYSYALTDGWGSGKSFTLPPPGSDQYIGVHDASPVWSGVSSLTVPYTFSNTACAHQLHLGGWANTTNGYSLIHYAADTEHIAIYLGGIPCQP
jgi:DNA-binding beta-propeller fold protein YncE